MPQRLRPIPLPGQNVVSHLQIFKDFHEIEVDVFVAGCGGEGDLQSYEPRPGRASFGTQLIVQGVPPWCSHPQGFPRGQVLQVVPWIQSEPRSWVPGGDLGVTHHTGGGRMLLQVGGGGLS